MASVLCIEGPTGAGVGAGVGGTGAGVGAGIEDEASEGALALASRDLGNVIVGSSGFQQFFLI